MTTAVAGRQCMEMLLSYWQDPAAAVVVRDAVHHRPLAATHFTGAKKNRERFFLPLSCSLYCTTRIISSLCNLLV